MHKPCYANRFQISTTATGLQGRYFIMSVANTWVPCGLSGWPHRNSDILQIPALVAKWGSSGMCIYCITTHRAGSLASVGITLQGTKDMLKESFLHRATKASSVTYD